MSKGEIFNMGRGWFNSAKVHKLLGFTLVKRESSAAVAAAPAAAAKRRSKA